MLAEQHACIVAVLCVYHPRTCFWSFTDDVEPYTETVDVGYLSHDLPIGVYTESFSAIATILDGRMPAFCGAKVPGRGPQ